MAILAAEPTLDFSVIATVADTIVSLVGKVVSMISQNPILFLSLGIGLFISAIGIVRRFV